MLREPAIDERVHRRVLAIEGNGPVGESAITELVRHEDPLLPADEVADIVTRVKARIDGVGAIEPLLSDPAITDVLVNGPGQVWVEREGRLVCTAIALDRSAIDLLVERIVSRLGLRADRSTPIVDARMPDGSRAHVVMQPLAVDGPCVTIRRFAAVTLPLDDFCGPAVTELLITAVGAGWNIVVCGSTGAGKTTLLNALCQHLPDGERVVTIEDAAELRLPGRHVVRLESRPATPDGLAAVSIRDLVRAALRMRPDRLVVGEVRGGEALDMLQALNTGHDGSLTTCHANSPVDALRRLETLCLMADVDLPLLAIREQLVGAVDLIVEVSRRPDGRRQVTTVAEVTPDAEARQRTRTLATTEKLLALPSRAPRRSAFPEDLQP